MRVSVHLNCAKKFSSGKLGGLVTMACSGATDNINISKVQGADSQTRRAAKATQFRRLRWCAASVFDLICTSESGEDSAVLEKCSLVLA